MFDISPTLPTGRETTTHPNRPCKHLFHFSKMQLPTGRLQWNTDISFSNELGLYAQRFLFLELVLFLEFFLELSFF